LNSAGKSVVSSVQGQVFKLALFGLAGVATGPAAVVTTAIAAGVYTIY